MKADYDAISDEWSNLRKVLPPKDKELFDFFIERLPKQAKILDLGCGSGVPIAKHLAQEGFSVLGVDRSENLLRKAKENVPNSNFHRSDIEDYAIEDTYDGVVLWDAIFHIPREKHQVILKKIYASLSSGGLLILSSGGSEEEISPFTDFMFGVEFFYDALVPKELLDTSKKIGFTIAKYTVVNKPDGNRDKGRIGVVLSKA